MESPCFYRRWITDGDLVSFHIAEEESDIYFRAVCNLEKEAALSLARQRSCLKEYIGQCPHFLATMEPYVVKGEAPGIAREMSHASVLAGVGPMAAVAGAIAEAVGRDLLAFSSEIIVENGGDIFLVTEKRRRVGIYAGSSPFSGKLALEIEPEDTPLGICTSSGTVGHSLSLGEADAVVILASSVALADAAATAVGNVAGCEADIPRALEKAQGIQGVLGVVVIKGEKMGAWGKVKIEPL